MLDVHLKDIYEIYFRLLRKTLHLLWVLRPDIM